MKRVPTTTIAQVSVAAPFVAIAGVMLVQRGVVAGRPRAAGVVASAPPSA